MSHRWTHRTVEALRLSRLPLDDDELALRLGAPRAQIGIVCRQLEAEGVLRRALGPGGTVVNVLAAGDQAPSRPGLKAVRTDTLLLSEDDVKTAVKAHLERKAWRVQVVWGRDHGFDIAARRGDETLYLMAKGEAGSPAQHTSFFLASLGELVHHLSDPRATYGLALPDNSHYRQLADRVPLLARERLNLAVYLVDPRAHLVRVA